MDVVERNLKIITQMLLLAVIAVVPFVKTESLYFPFVSGKAYVFRALVAVALFFWLWLLLKDQDSRIKVQGFLKNILVVAIALFFGVQLLAALFGVDPLYSFFSSIERVDGVLQYGFWLLYFFMFLSVFREEKDWKLFFGVFVAVAVLLSGYSWLNHASQPQLYAVFGNPAYFAALLLFAIGFAFIAYERKLFFPGPVHYALLAAIGLFVLTLVFTQVRGGYVGFAGGVFLFSLLSVLFLRKENKKLARGCSIVLLGGIVSLAVLFAAKDTDFVQETRLLYRITEVTAFWDSGSVRERLLNWNIALKAFRERPLLGYGPENFASAANKYYDYRIGVGEPWFDRAHNQPLDTLATGGIIVFVVYLFWLAVAGFLILQIAKKQKVLGFLAAGLFFAYFLQGFFLFDLLAVYLGLFPFLAFLIYQSYELPRRVGSLPRGERIDTNIQIPNQNTKYQIPNTKYIVLVPVAVLSLAVIYFTVVVPWKANAAAIQFFGYSESGFFKESLPFLKKAFGIQSPYTTWEVRKRAGWQFVQVLEDQVDEKTNQEKIAELQEIYDIMTPELEKFIEARPYDPQVYYVLGRTYRFGFQKLGKEDLEKAEAVFERAFAYSDLRVEYINEFSQVLLLQGKFEKAEQMVKAYAERVDFYEYFPYLTIGHFYFVAGEYEKAFQQYEKAREAGYEFVEITPEYSRYMFAAEATEQYEKVVDMAKAYINRWGPDADTYFNIAVGYFHLGDKEKAKEFFLKATEANPKYKDYEFKSLFLE